MSKINDGGPAFPHPNPDYAQDYGRRDRTPPFGGMTLRDWFAGQALAGMFRHVGWLNTIDGDEVEAARRAFAIADAMLAAREVQS